MSSMHISSKYLVDKVTLKGEYFDKRRLCQKCLQFLKDNVYQNLPRTFVFYKNFNYI